MSDHNFHLAGVLKKYYLPSAFLYLTSEGNPYRQLYQEMLLTLEPMAYLPFDLSIDFEIRQAPSTPAGGVAAGGGGVANGNGQKASLTPIGTPRVLSPSPEPSSPSVSAH